MIYDYSLTYKMKSNKLKKYKKLKSSRPIIVKDCFELNDLTLHFGL